MESNIHIRETKGHSRVIPTFFQHHSNVFLTVQILVFCPPSLLKGPNLTELLPSKYTPSFLMSRMPNRNSAVASGVTKLRTLYAAHYRVSSLTLPHKSIKVAWMTAHLAIGVTEDLLLLICLSTNQLIVQTIAGPRDTYLIVCRHLRVHKS